jgi:hypothetical protein
MAEFKIRCSSIGYLMTEAAQVDANLRTPEIAAIIAKTKRTDEEKAALQLAKDNTLSVGAKTYVRRLVAQEIFGIDFEVSSKQMEKGKLVEGDSISMLARVRGISIEKNTIRLEDDFITGECDIFRPDVRIGHDVKSSWSAATFPISIDDCYDSLYEWQMRGYMKLWNAEAWEVNYCLVNTPEHLIGFEPQSMHFVDHIPERMRVTTWRVERDLEKEVAIVRKVKLAREYFSKVVAEFDETHRGV